MSSGGLLLNKLPVNRMEVNGTQGSLSRERQNGYVPMNQIRSSMC